MSNPQQAHGAPQAIFANSEEAQKNETRAARLHPLIGVHLTPFAPGMGNRHISDPDRWKRAMNLSAPSFMRTLLKRLGQAPGAVRVERQANGDVAIVCPTPPAMLGHLSSYTDGFAPMAFIHQGLTPDETETALAELVAAHWSPVAAQPFAD